MHSCPIYFITSNQAKITQLAQISALSTYPIIPVKLDIDEIQSTDNTIVAQDKIIKAYEYIKSINHTQPYWVMCEDTGYSFANMGEFPGALIRYYHDSVGNTGICKFHAGTRATNISCVAITNGKESACFTNRVTGTVPEKPRGITNGTKWVELDPVFVPDYPDNLNEYSGLAYSEIPIPIKSICSARAKSFSQLAEWLDNEYPNGLSNNVKPGQTQMNLTDLTDLSDFETKSCSDTDFTEFDFDADNLSNCAVQDWTDWELNELDETSLTLTSV